MARESIWQIVRSLQTQVRPHSSRGCLTPEEYTQTMMTAIPRRGDQEEKYINHMCQDLLI